MNTQSAPKNVTLIDTLGQMGSRLCLLGMLGFLGALGAQNVWGSEGSSASMTFQLLISCWGFAAAGGMLFVGSHFVVAPYKKKKPKSRDGAKETAFQLAKLGARYRVFNGIDIVDRSGQAHAFRHVVIGPNGVFHVAPFEEATQGKEASLRELLFERNIRNLDISSVVLPTPRLIETIQQQKAKRRLTAAEVSRIAELIEGASRPSVLKEDVERTSPLVWVVPVAVFGVVVSWIVMGNGAGVW